MYVENDICYSEDYEDCLKVRDVTPLGHRMMLVTFSNGEKRLFDTTLLKGSAFAPLADEKICNHPVLFHGVITWKNGEIDIAPETVYKWSSPYEKEAL